MQTDRRTIATSISFLVFGIAAFLTTSVGAQSIDLTAGNTGISFGDSEEITGIRFNFKDVRLRRMTGLNVTIWSPSEDIRSTVTGVAIGLPLAGARNFTGLGVGVLGFGAQENTTGIIAGLLGAGAGQDMFGIGIGGLGAGAGRDVQGIMIGGLGAGSGRNAKGIMIGGLGAGSGNDAVGVMIAGLGAGSGNDAVGVMFGGLGAGAGRDATGMMFSILAAGAGRNLTGISAAGIAVGAGEKLEGVHVAGIAVGAPEITGFAGALVVGGERIKGLVIAPAYFRVGKNGQVNGLTISAFNHVKGEHRGVSIGILNWAEKLNGLQIGLLNFAGNKDKLKWLPFFNYHRD